MLSSRTTLYMHSGAAALDDLTHASVGHAAGDRAESSVDPPADTRPGLDLAFGAHLVEGEFCDVPRAFSKRAFGLGSLLHSPCSLVPVPFTLGARYSTTTPMTSLATVIVSSRMLRSICIRRCRRWLASATVHHIASTYQRQRDMLLEYLLEVCWITLIHVVVALQVTGAWAPSICHLACQYQLGAGLSTMKPTPHQAEAARFPSPEAIALHYEDRGASSVCADTPSLTVSTCSGRDGRCEG